MSVHRDHWLVNINGRARYFPQTKLKENEYWTFIRSSEKKKKTIDNIAP